MALTSSTNPKNQNPVSKVLTQFAVEVRFSSLNTVPLIVPKPKAMSRQVRTPGDGVQMSVSSLGATFVKQSLPENS